MSKAVKTDHEYDKEKLKSLLQKAKGKRTQTEYAKQAGVGIAYLNKYIRGAQDNPPIPSTLFKLSSVADNDVTYDELLYAAGYNPQKYNKPGLTEKQLEDLAFAILSRNIHSITAEWELLKDVSNGMYRYDMCAQYKHKRNNDPKWVFHMKFGTPKIMIRNKREWFLNSIGFFAVSEINTGDKVSLVTNDADFFNEIVTIEQVLLGFHLSLLLIDFDSMSILDEKYIRTALLTEDRNRFPSFCNINSDGN